MNIVICDTCSLIKLYKGGVLGLLGKLYDKVYIPQAVLNECNTKTQKALALPFIEVIKVHHVLNIGMGLGEREAISLAVELNIKKIITDDNKAINNAIRQGLKPQTIFQILVIAKRLGFIKAVKPILDKIIENGDGIRKDIYDQTLREVQEI